MLEEEDSEQNSVCKVPDQQSSNWNLGNPVRREELDTVLESMLNSAAGTDRIQLQKPRNMLLLLFNNVNFLTNIHPKWLVEGRVTLIPKMAKPKSPKDFCPITVLSVLLRVLHKILAKRCSEWNQRLSCVYK